MESRRRPKFQFKDLAASKIQEICNDLLPPLALPRLAASKARTEEDTVLLLDLKTGQLVREIRASADLFAFGPLGKRMAYVRETAANDAGRDKQRSIFVEHTRTGETIRRIDLPTRPYSCATVSHPFAADSFDRQRQTAPGRIRRRRERVRRRACTALHRRLQRHRR